MLNMGISEAGGREAQAGTERVGWKKKELYRLEMPTVMHYPADP
jgi:hypothetical protein